MHTTYGSVFPEPDPHGSIIIHINMTCSELGEAGSSLSLFKKKRFIYFFLLSPPVFDGGKERQYYLKKMYTHGGNYIK